MIISQAELGQFCRVCFVFSSFLFYVFLQDALLFPVFLAFAGVVKQSQAPREQNPESSLKKLVS